MSRLQTLTAVCSAPGEERSHTAPGTRLRKPTRGARDAPFPLHGEGTEVFMETGAGSRVF